MKCIFCPPTQGQYAVILNIMIHIGLLSYHDGETSSQLNVDMKRALLYVSYYCQCCLKCCNSLLVVFYIEMALTYMHHTDVSFSLTTLWVSFLNVGSGISFRGYIDIISLRPWMPF